MTKRTKVMNELWSKMCTELHSYMFDMVLVLELTAGIMIYLLFFDILSSLSLSL